MGWVVNDTPWYLYRQERDPVAIVQEAGWASRPAWTGGLPLSFESSRIVQRIASRSTEYTIPPHLITRLPKISPLLFTLQ